MLWIGIVIGIIAGYTIFTGKVRSPIETLGWAFVSIIALIIMGITKLKEKLLG